MIRARQGSVGMLPVLLLIGVSALALLTGGCSKRPAGAKENLLFSHSLDDFAGVVDVSSVQIDPGNAAQGGGSARIEVAGDATVKLFEVPDPDVEAAVLSYRAKLKTQNLGGRAYLEMWCRFPGKGEFFSRGLQNPLTGTTDWTEAETPFFLKKGENPDYVRMNLVIEGGGTVWVDDVRLVASSR